MFGIFKSTEFVKLGNSIDNIYLLIQKIDNEFSSDNEEFEMNEEIFIVAYMIRKGFIERVHLLKLNIDSEIYLSSFGNKKVTLFDAYDKTIHKLQSIAYNLDLYDEVKSILEKEIGYYELESSLSRETLKTINKLIYF